ncbi:MAG: hypothetical protein QOG99_3531, partial [Frankiales bacterium]|nr:hypothetical protein [Frankiales bacterium]
MSTVAAREPVPAARKAPSSKNAALAPVPSSPGRVGDKRAAQVARRIEDDVAAAGWPVGQVLGTEAELTERYGVSRSVLREAVRLVEHHQVAQMRRGPGGGLIVQAPDMKGATAALVIYLEFVDTSVADLMDVRLILEPLAVGLATQRLTESGIHTLRQAVAEESAVIGHRPAA